MLNGQTRNTANLTVAVWLIKFSSDAVCMKWQMHNQLEIQFSGLQLDYDNLRVQLEEEQESSVSIRNQLSKAQADYQALKSKFDKEVSAKVDELEEIR